MQTLSRWPTTSVRLRPAGLQLLLTHPRCQFVTESAAARRADIRGARRIPNAPTSPRATRARVERSLFPPLLPAQLSAVGVAANDSLARRHELLATNCAEQSSEERRGRTQSLLPVAAMSASAAAKSFSAALKKNAIAAARARAESASCRQRKCQSMWAIADWIKIKT